MMQISSRYHAHFPNWSSDGNKIVFVSTRNGLVLLDLQTKFETIIVIPTIESKVLSPKISSDNKKILYYYNYQGVENTDSEIRLVNISSGLITFVADTYWNYNFVWHPSSKEIFFEKFDKIYKVHAAE